MNFMYKVCQTDDGTISVEPIIVVRRGILPGCSNETITAIDSNARRFTSDPANFHATETEAWDNARAKLISDINKLGVEIDKLETKYEFLKFQLENCLNHL